MVTRAQVNKMSWNTTIYDKKYKNADGSAVRYRVNGALKTWKTRPTEFQLPIKHGLRDYGYLTHENMGAFTLNEPKKVDKSRVSKGLVVRK